MRATINGLPETETLSGNTLCAIRCKLMGLLSIGGYRQLTATTTTGAVIHVSLYDDDSDYIRLRNGRLYNWRIS
jgi:hypothetical protein